MLIYKFAVHNYVNSLKIDREKKNKQIRLILDDKLIFKKNLNEKNILFNK